MIIDKKLLDDLSVQAKANPRLRQTYDLRTMSDDKCQRMLNALESGTIMPIHRHRNASETMVMVIDKLIERFYGDNGDVTDEFVMEPCGQYPMVLIETGRWNSLNVIGRYNHLRGKGWRIQTCKTKESVL